MNLDNLLKTPLYGIYERYGAKIVDFAGWALPVQFSGVIHEHETVRTRAGLFDVSHMGEILISGKNSAEFLDHMLANEVFTLEPGKIRYAHLCNQNGGVVDDVLVYRYDENEYLLVVNAANTQKDFDWIKSYAPKDVNIENISDNIAQMAIQGPASEKIIQSLTSVNLSQIGYYSFVRNIKIAGYNCMLSRTGYTGEDGFEIYCSPENAVSLWECIIEAGKDYDLLPVGLGARDTLRFEACMPLYGHELSEEISPLEAGLERYVKLTKPDFIGKKALVKQVAYGLRRKLMGLEMLDRGIPRNGYSVLLNGERIGYVTSGSYCPTLKKNLGLALLKIQYADIGRIVEVEIRGKELKAKVIGIPFYRGIRR